MTAAELRRALAGIPDDRHVRVSVAIKRVHNPMLRSMSHTHAEARACAVRALDPDEPAFVIIAVEDR